MKKMIGDTVSSEIRKITDPSISKRIWETIQLQNKRLENPNLSSEKPLVLRTSIYILMVSVLFVFLVGVVLQFVTHVLFVQPESVGGFAGMTQNVLISFIALGFSILLLAYVVGLWYMRRYTISEEDIVASEGIFRRERTIFATKNIESIQLRQSFIGRILGFGTLCLYAPTLRKYVYIRNIPHPKKIQKLLDTYMHEAGGGSNVQVMSDVSAGTPV